MALPTITFADFKGWSKIVANSFKQEDLAEYITQYREEYLRLIVGDSVFLSIADEVRTKWTDLLSGRTYTDEEGVTRKYSGLIQPLVWFIYFEFVRNNYTQTQGGAVDQFAENSTRTAKLEVLSIARSRYNKATRQINEELCRFVDAFEEMSQTVTASTDLGAGQYTLDIAGTEYLAAGDMVAISGQDYIVLAVVADTSATIEAGAAGLDFAGSTVIWKPYKDVEVEYLEPCGI